MAESLTVAVSGDLVVEEGGLIDASDRGYPGNETYPGASGPGSYTGGSHLGYGGYYSSGGSPNSTYGSVTRPQEAGSGGSAPYSYDPGKPGGGVVRLTVGGDLQCDGLIRSNGSGELAKNAGAGGSIWIGVAGNVAGSGAIEAVGGTTITLPHDSFGGGGGGAIALEYGGLLSIPTTSFNASGSSTYHYGGAGTVFLKGPDSTFGDLTVDNKDVDGPSTVLPALGSGLAQTGSSGTTLITDKTSIPAYFVGHWVEVSAADGTAKGTWQILAIDGSALTLADGATVAEGDSWQGVYRFDSLTVQGKAKLIVGDADDFGTVTVAADSTLQRLNRFAPSIDPSKVSIFTASGAYWVSGAEGAVTDVDGISTAAVTNLALSQSWPISVEADGSFQAVHIAGSQGDELEISATDAGTPALSSTSQVGYLPEPPPLPVVAFSSGTTTVDESGGTATLSVDLSFSILSGQVSVDWATVSGSAFEEEDYEAAFGTLIFNPEQTSQTIAVTIIDDSVTEPDETFSIVLSNPAGAILGDPDTMVVTIPANNDDISPTIDPTAFTLSFVDCAFRLDGDPDAVTPRQGDAGAYVHVTVDNPEPAADWSTALVWVDEATEFSFDLGLAVEPGAAITVTAEDEVEDLSSTALVAHALSVPPTFTAEHTTRIWRDETDSAVVTVDPIDITDISGPVTLRLSNLTAGTSSTLAMACPASSPASISIAAAPSDEVAVEACTGSQVLVCSDTPIDLGMAGVLPIDLDGATVTGMWRSGPTVLVGTDTGIARVISLDDPSHPAVLPWQVPLPNGAPAGVIGRGPSSVAYADGSHLLLWDATAGIVSDLEPLGAGMPIDLVLVRGTNAIVAGHDASGVVVATAASDVGPSGTLCPGGSPLTLSSTTGLTPLALLPLSSGRVGVLTDDVGQPIRLFDVDGPSEPEPSIRLLLQDLPAPAQAAWLDDDWLTVYGADNQLYQYRMPQPGTGAWWSGERTLVVRADYGPSIAPRDTPLAVVRSGFLEPIVAYADGIAAFLHSAFDFGTP